MFGGAYVVDDFRWCSRRCSSAPATSVVLLSTNYIDEGDYYEGEYYILLLSSVLGHDR